MTLDFPGAFDPLLADDVDVRCVRSGEVLTGAAKAAVLKGTELADVAGGASRASGQAFTALVPKGMWTVEEADDGTPSPPAFGDEITHKAYGVLTVQTWQDDGEFWALRCIGKGILRR